VQSQRTGKNGQASQVARKENMEKNRVRRQVGELLLRRAYFESLLKENNRRLEKVQARCSHKKMSDGVCPDCNFKETQETKE